MNVKTRMSASFLVALFLSGGSVYADAPVVDASSGQVAQERSSDIILADASNAGAMNNHDGTATEQSEASSSAEASQASAPDMSHLSVDQRLTRLEHQVNNIANLNLPQQMSLLQQQLAQLRGQLEVQGHDLQLLNKQLRSFYQDLDNRINQMKNLNAGNNSSASVNNNVLASATSVELQDANAYQIAFGQLVSHRLDKAKQSFENYLNQYPNGKYVADAYYWLGEIYLTNKDYQRANKNFETILKKYPNSSKVSDAKLKMAIIHANMGKVSQAKNELQSIRKSHPNSTAAQLANIRLQQLDEGSDITQE